MNASSTKRFYEDVGRRVKQARDRARLTQEELAMRLSMTRTSVTNIERGRQKVLLHTIVQLADVLQVSIESLVPARGEPSRDVSQILTLLEEHPEPIQKWIGAALAAEKR